MKFYFSGFVYDTQQKILQYQTEPVELTRKCHELLSFLLEQPGQLVSKDKLINHVWQGRVVTNNTIDQCILKLRKALNQQHKADYIESVYGQGIRFLPKVETETSQPIGHDQADTSLTSQKNQWLLFCIIMLVMSGWLLFKPEAVKKTNTFETRAPSINIISQSSINDSAINQNWINAGGIHYLNHLLSGYANLSAQNSRQQILADSTNKTLLIDLIYSDKSQWTLYVDTQTFENDQGMKQYQAQLSLRNRSGRLAQQQLHTHELKNLFTQMAHWVSQQEGSETEYQVIDPTLFSDNDYALQSYFLAMSAQNKGDSQQALTYLQSAIEQDPDFKMAWYEMAIAYRKQADPRKALSILNALDSNDPNMAYRVSLVKAQCLDTLGEFAFAEQAYQQALKHAENSTDSRKIATVYISQGILYRKTKQYNMAEQALQQAASIVDPEVHTHLYGTVMNTYAKLAREMNQPLLAIEKAKLAIDAFQRSGDLRYQMQSKTVLASILRLRNEFSQAERLVKESLFHAEQLQHHRGISDNRTKLARIYQQTGRFRLAHQQWQQVLKLNAELELSGNSAEAYLWLLKLHLAENNLTQAEIDLKMMEQLHLEHPENEITLLWLEAQLILALHLNDIEQAQSLITELINHSHHKIKTYQGDLAYLQRKYPAAELHYLEALVTLNDSGRFDQMVEIMNRLNQLYLVFNTEKITENLQKTKKLNAFIYPLQKYQALAAAKDGKHILAVSLMEELKLKAGDYWQFEDQQLLEKFRKEQVF